MLSIVTPATGTRLTTIAAVRAQAVVGDDVDDITVGEWIDQASASIVSHCRRRFARETVTQTFLRPANGPLILDRAPLIAAPAVVSDGLGLLDDEMECDLAAGLIYRLHGDCRGGWFSRRLTVTYTAGWSLPGSPDRDLPADIEQACLTLVAARAAGMGRDPMLRSRTVEGVGSTSWIASADMGALPPQAASLLAPYVRYVMG
ncbi:hypothetical protein [Pseudoroseomonas ludipueritiae]|uniref:Phage gp6-like head-tail connector protein n=1 Tax=Pseudoroseomonas ludipueritiae TaxID=198093 RepID=A0ABR7R4T1_9PROT|nr:hypothetical protein [Pseudoroseomonas ludipueritiae]MBC9176769.1 hypothetical protein [Pseudoroseomonas ludipueritiae]